MPTVIHTEYGKITITEEVIASAVGIAAMHTYGLADMAPRRNVRDSLTGLLGRGDPARGVEIRSVGDQLEITLYVIVNFGTRIPEVAENLRENVNNALQESLGLVADQVNINVQGIKLSEPPAAIIE